MALIAVYCISAAALLYLFIRSRGLFRKSARHLKTVFPSLREVPESTLRLTLITFSCALMLSGLITLRAYLSDTVREGYLMRGTYGTEAEEEALTATTAAGRKQVTITVEPRLYTAEETQQLLTEAETTVLALLESAADPSHVDTALPFVTELPGSPVMLSWMTDRPQDLDWNGEPGVNIPENGIEVHAVVQLSLQDQRREREFVFTVFPRRLKADEQFTADLEKTIAAEDETSPRLILPDSVGGEETAWSRSLPAAGPLFLLLGVLVSLYLPAAAVRQKKDAEKAREMQLLFDFPSMAGKLSLLIGAGLSQRQAVAKLASDYQKSLKRGSPKRAGYELLLKVYLDMAHGESELAAYRNLGTACRLPRYKTLASLLSRNLTKGSPSFLSSLRREASEAAEERRTKVRLLGEVAGTKLLGPMILMLGIVLVIMMAPAFLTML